jgi:uncharacterized protein DUF5666
MKHSFTHVVTIAAGLTIIGVLGAAGLVSAQTKEARGAVTAISNSSMTVAVGKENMTFIIDQGTKVEVKAAAKKTREAKSTDSAGIPITEYIKTGNPVLVRYREEKKGEYHALSVRPVSSGKTSSSRSPDSDVKVASGTVKEVTASQLTLASEGQDLIFAINRDTDVLTRDASKTTKAAGGTTKISDFIQRGDNVSVTYLSAGNALTASQVRVRSIKNQNH